MKVAFIYVPANQSIPLGIAYLSSVIKQENFKTAFFLLSGKNDTNCLNSVCEYSPDVVAYSIITGNQELYLEFNRKVKAQLNKVVSVLGGPHPTFFPEIISEDGIDAVCLGEGEYAFRQFMLSFMDLGTLPKNVQNFWIKHDGEISKSELMPLITDLDALPFPDREGFFKVDAFTKEFVRKTVIATRGCPYTCAYCFNGSFNKLYSNRNILRFRSPKNICEEILDIQSKYKVKSIYFPDDVFTINKSWVLNFCEEYKKK